MPHTLEDYLFEIHQGLTQRGIPEMDDDTLRELSKALQQPQLMQQLQSGQVTTQQIVEEAIQGLQAVSEGGDIADRSGKHTQKIRNQLGLGMEKQAFQ